MAKRGELKPMDAWEHTIRDNAVAYNVVMFRPGKSSRVYQSFDNLDKAIAYSEITLQEPTTFRSAMVYAIDKGEHHALVGTMIKYDLQWKPVEAQTW